jgi:hypothetical protein
MPKTATKEKFPSEEASTYYDGYLTDNSDGVPYVVKSTSNGSKKWVKQEADSDGESEKSDKSDESDVIINKMKKVELTKTKTKSKSKPEPASAEDKNTSNKLQNTKAKKKAPELVASKSSDEPHIEDIRKNTKPAAAAAKPKRALTAYNMFVAVKLKELRLKHPGLVSTKYMEMAGAQWSSMSDVKKKLFAEKHPIPTTPSAAA